MPYKEFEELFRNNREWIQEKLKIDEHYFEKLAEGQHPEYLMIGCSDSRVPMSSLTRSEPGKVFLHRNIANQINLTDINFLSVLEYSVEHLHVKHIIVLGHYRCGGLAAAVDGVDQGLIENWVSPIHDMYKAHKPELDEITDKNDAMDRLSEINVIEQAKNLFKTPVIARAFKREMFPRIHGWIFDIYTGEIKPIELPVDEWKKQGLVPEFY